MSLLPHSPFVNHPQGHTGARLRLAKTRPNHSVDFKLGRRHPADRSCKCNTHQRNKYKLRGLQDAAFFECIVRWRHSPQCAPLPPQTQCCFLNQKGSRHCPGTWRVCHALACHSRHSKTPRCEHACMENIAKHVVAVLRTQDRPAPHMVFLIEVSEGFLRGAMHVHHDGRITQKGGFVKNASCS